MWKADTQAFLWVHLMEDYQGIEFIMIPWQKQPCDANVGLHQARRFLGNWLHVIFQSGGVYFFIFENLKKFVLGRLPKNKLVAKLKDLIVEEAADIELQVLGILGKMLSRPWMN